MNTIKLNTIGERPIKKGGASGGGGLTYFDFSNVDRAGFSPFFMATLGTVLKIENYNDRSVYYLTPDFFFEDAPEDCIIGVAINMGAKIEFWVDGTLKLATIAEYLEMLNASNEFEMPAPVSEEDFYNYATSPEKEVLLKTDDGEQYITFINGMGWGTWVNSTYNALGLYIDEQGRITNGKDLLWSVFIQDNGAESNTTVGSYELISLGSAYRLKTF